MADSGPVWPAAFARTYDPRTHADAWELVEEYRAVMDYHDRNPAEGSYTVAGAFDLPAERVRAWFDGATPDCIRGLEAAEEHGWLDCGFGGRTFRGLNVFAAWVFSGGSINRSYVPHFVVDDEADRGRLDRAAEAVGVTLDFTRRADPDRATELRPAAKASILGRVLAALDVPVGSKNDRGPLSLPWYLDAAPVRVRREFVRTYLETRGQPSSGSATRTLREARPESYLERLAALIRATTDGDVEVSGQNVLVSAEAVETIRGWPPALDDGAPAPDDVEGVNR